MASFLGAVGTGGLAVLESSLATAGLISGGNFSSLRLSGLSHSLTASSFFSGIISGFGSGGLMPWITLTPSLSLAIF